MPRKMCIHAQNSGHALEPMGALNYGNLLFFRIFRIYDTYVFSVRMEYPFSRMLCLTLSKSFTGGLRIFIPDFKCWLY